MNLLGVICSSLYPSKFEDIFLYIRGVPGSTAVKNPPAMHETAFGSLGWEDPLEKG